MIFTETKLPGAFVIELEKQEDERGFFARQCCQKEFAAHGLSYCVVQTNISQTKAKGTVRGMHYQAPPFAETKLVQCIRGAVYDVILDLRPSSPTYKQWIGVELTARNYKTLYIPEGFAHGFQALEDDSEVSYQMSQFYTPRAARGVRYDDRAFAIRWSLPVRLVSPKDRSWPDYAEQEKVVS